MLSKPIAVIRRDIIAETGPSIYGIKRMDKVKSPANELWTFLGVCDGVAHLERDEKSAGEPFIEIDSEDMIRWKKV